MEQNLEVASETVRQQQPPAEPASGREKLLEEKLYDIYVEECEKEPEAEELQNLLKKLMKREALPCLVVNLYPENQGYSLMLKDKDGSLSETFQLPYEVEKLLEYLNVDELPSLLIDVLENSPVNVFHHGCVIAEIRDYRQSSDTYPPGEPGAEPTESPPVYQTRYTLLYLSMQSLVSGEASMTSDNHPWTQEERRLLESQLLLAADKSPRLDSCAADTCTDDELLFNDQNLDTDPMRQCFKRPASPFQDQKEESFGCRCPPESRTMTPFKKQAKIGADSPSDLKIDGAEPTVSSAPEVNYGSMFDYEDDSQLWDMDPYVMNSLNDPLFCGEIEPLPEDRSHNDMDLPPMSLDNYSGDCMAGINTEPRQTVVVCQEPVQSKVMCQGEMPQVSSSSLGLPQPSLGNNPTMSSVAPSVLEEESGTPVPGSQGFSAVTSIPELAGGDIPSAPQAATVIHQTIVEVNRVSTLPLAVQPIAGSSENNSTIQHSTITTDVNVIHLVRSLPNTSSLVDNSTQVLHCSTSATASEGTAQNSLPPTGEQLPEPAQHPVQLIINNTSSPLTVTLPLGSVILSPEPQEPSQEQLQQPQQIYVLIPKHQPPTASAPPQSQPVPPASSEVSNHQEPSLPIQHTSRINIEQTDRINTVGGRVVQQTQTSVVCHVESTHQSHGENVHSQSFQISATLIQEGPPQAQNLEVTITPHIVTVSTAGTQHSEGGHAAGEPRDRGTGGPPTSPTS